MWNSTWKPESPKCIKCTPKKEKPRQKGPFLCSFTGKAHSRLSGAMPHGNKKFMTSGTEEYPAPFADWALRLLKGETESEL